MGLVIVAQGIRETEEREDRLGGRGEIEREAKGQPASTALFNRPVSAKAQIKRLVCRNYTTGRRTGENGGAVRQEGDTGGMERIRAGGRQKSIRDSSVYARATPAAPLSNYSPARH